MERALELDLCSNPVTSCVTLGKLLYFSEPQLPHP